MFFVPRVLIVDDRPAFRRQMRRLLERAGAGKTCQICNGEKGART